MAGGNYEFQSEFAKKHQATGRAEGRAEGELKGRAEGELKGRAEAVLDVLAARGLRVPEDARACILACSDADQLAAWVRKAVTAASVEDLF